MKRVAVPLLLLSFLCLIPVAPSVAQSDAATALTVTTESVEIRRTGTEAWIWLPFGATTPFGVGDVLRTSRRGRAFLDLGDGSSIVVLPESQLTLTQFLPTDEGYRLEMLLSGGRIIQNVNESAFAEYKVFTPQATVTSSGGAFGIKAEVTESTRVDTYVVDSGAIEVTFDVNTVTLAANEGFRIGPDAVSEVITIADVPINFGRIDGAIDGCPGTVATDGRLLRVRGGPSDGFYFMGSLENGTPVELMAQAWGPGGIWYRIQYLSDFGWVEGALVSTACADDDLPLLSNVGSEDAVGVIYWQPREVEVLEPFFGLPDDDVWFYRRVQGGE